METHNEERRVVSTNCDGIGEEKRSSKTAFQQEISKENGAMGGQSFAVKQVAINDGWRHDTCPQGSLLGRLTGRHDGLDVETHRSLRRVDAADQGEAETLVTGALFVDNGVKRLRRAGARHGRCGRDRQPGTARQGAKIAGFLVARRRRS